MIRLKNDAKVCIFSRTIELFPIFFIYFVSFCSTKRHFGPNAFYVLFLRKNLQKCLVVSDIFCNFVSGNKGKKIARKQTPQPPILRGL